MAKNTTTKDAPPASTLDPALTQEPTTVATTAPPAPPPVKHAKSAGGYDVTDVGTGFEDFTQDDLAVPFLAILQKNSPQVEEENPKHIKGTKAGMIMDTVSNELYDGKVGVPVIPVHRVRNFIEWIPRDDGGGLVNVFSPDAPEVRAVLAKAGRKFGKLKINDNNDLMETFNVFCLMPLSDGRSKRVVIGMSSSQITMYKKWMTRAQSIQRIGADGMLGTPPMFSHRYRLTTVFHQKKENTWYKWVAAFDGSDAAACNIPETDPMFEAAKQFRALITSGAVTASFESMQQEPSDGGDDGYEM